MEEEIVFSIARGRSDSNPRSSAYVLKQTEEDDEMVNGNEEVK